jgi:hypothetical protein
MPEGTGFRNPSLWLMLLSLIATMLSTYVGLRLEPLYQQVQRIEVSLDHHEEMTQGYANDYIAFKAQTIEILRQQNLALERVEAIARRRAQ